MAKNKPIHPAAKALAYELDEWLQSPEDSGWYFGTVDGRLTATELDAYGNIAATYSVALADIPFTKNKES